MPGIKDFREKVIVITGAGSGIGRATALAFASEGANIVAVDIKADRLDEVKSEIEKRGAKASTKIVDVSSREQVADLAKYVIEKYGRVDILYNNAGVGTGGLIEATPYEDWEWVFKINFWGVYNGVHAFLPYMIERQYGHIVNTASGAGIAPLVSLGAYTSTKYAVVGMSEVLRAEVRRHNIGVSVICPGIINTNIVADGRAHIPQGAKADQQKMTDFYKKRGWPPERVAKAVLNAVRKNKGIVPVGPEAWLGWYMMRISPSLYNAMSAYIVKNKIM